jgi:hypothetical protein
MLGWKPKRKVADVLRIMIKNMLKNPALWYKANGLKPPKHIEYKWQKEKQLKREK